MGKYLINVRNKTVPYCDYFISTHKINDDLPNGSTAIVLISTCTAYVTVDPSTMNSCYSAVRRIVV